MTDAPQVTRVRHDTRRRKLTVARVEPYAASMLRMVLTGEELEGFTSLGFDDHVKVFFPTGPVDTTSPDALAAMASRDFTPRHFDAAKNELWIDFFVHEAGPATSWATGAKAGDTLIIGGPKGSAVLASEGIQLQLMIGDETAIAAIARRLEELPADARTLVMLEVEPGSSWPDFSTAAQSEVLQVARTDDATPAAALIDRLRSVQLPPEGCFVWVALESQSARAIRRYMTEDRGIGKQWIKASAYWQRGAIGKHERIED